MSTINGINETNLPVNNSGSQTGSSNDQGSNTSFSNVLSDAIKEQALQSVMQKMGSTSSGSSGSGFSGLNPMSGTMGSIGGTNAMLGGLGGLGGPGALMPSISSGMENTLISAAGTGEMSGAQLMLFMMIMMMQSGSSGGGSDMMPIMQMLAGLLRSLIQMQPQEDPTICLCSVICRMEVITKVI